MDKMLVGISEDDAKALASLLRSHASQDMKVIELGSFTGSSSLAMLPVISQWHGRLYCIDWFKGSPGEGGSQLNLYRDHDVLNVFRTNIREAGFEDRVFTMIGTTDVAAELVGNETADVIFIDADHRYDAVWRDIVTWYPKLKKGGILCGHDFDMTLRECHYLYTLGKSNLTIASQMTYSSERTRVSIRTYHPGVTRAVCELLPDARQSAAIWHVQKDRQPELELAMALNGHRGPLDMQFLHACTEEALGRSRDPAYTRASIAVILSNSGRKQEALGFIDRALTENPQQEPLMALLGCILEETGDVRASLQAFLRLAMVRSDEHVHNKIGEIAYRLGELDLASKHFLQGNNLSPANPDILSNLAVLSWQRGDRRKAMESLESALKYAQGRFYEYPDLLLNYAMVLEKSGKAQEALHLLTQMDELYQGVVGVKESLTELRQRLRPAETGL